MVGGRFIDNKACSACQCFYYDETSDVSREYGFSMAVGCDSDVADVGNNSPVL